MDVVVYDDEDRRYVPAHVTLLFGVLVALLAVGLTVLFTGHRTADPVPLVQPAPVVGSSDPQAGEAQPAPEPACTQALAQGDAALQRAKAISSALGAQTSAVDDLLARRITREQLLARSLPVLTASATDRTRFAQELATYERSRAGCGTSADDGTGG